MGHFRIDTASPQLRVAGCTRVAACTLPRPGEEQRGTITFPVRLRSHSIQSFKLKLMNTVDRQKRQTEDS